MSSSSAVEIETKMDNQVKLQNQTVEPTTTLNKYQGVSESTDIGTLDLYSLIKEFSTLWNTDRLGAVTVGQRILSIVAKMETIPPQLYRLLYYNLSYMNLSGKHIVIVNVNNGVDLNPEGIAQTRNSSGSEEALIRISDELVKLGYRITILGKVASHAGYTLPGNNPRYYHQEHLNSLTNTDHVDAIIAWRRTDFFRLSYFTKAPCFYIPHDWFSNVFSTRSLRGCIFLTPFQESAYLKGIPELADVPRAIGGNGVVPEHHLLSENRVPTRCVYLQAYHRGLEGVLRVWPRIRDAHPEATLDIYYGRQCWGLMKDEQLNAIVQRIDELKPHGVTEIGSVPHRVLCEKLSSASFMVNMSSFMETYNICLAKALASGVIPVITDVVDPGMVPKEIKLLPHNDLQLDDLFVKQLNHHISLAKSDLLTDLRISCRNHALTNLTWSASAKRIANFIESNM